MHTFPFLGFLGHLGSGPASNTSSLILTPPRQFPQMLLQVLPITLRACVLRRNSEVNGFFIHPFPLSLLTKKAFNGVLTYSVTQKEGHPWYREDILDQFHKG